MFNLLPKEFSDCLVQMPILNDFESPKFIQNCGFTIKPQGLINKFYFSKNPSAFSRFFTHLRIYDLILSNNIDAAIVLEDDIVLSDLLSLLSDNPNFPDEAQLCNLSAEGILKFNAYYITNTGASLLKNFISNNKWLNGVKQFKPRDFFLSELDTLKVFSQEENQVFNHKNNITAPINYLVDELRFTPLINFDSRFQYINSIKTYQTFSSTLFDKNATEDSLLTFKKSNAFEWWKDLHFNNSGIDYIFYINLDKDLKKMELMENSLESLDIPFQRFSAIKPERQDVCPKAKYESLFKSSKFLECRDYFGEISDHLNLDQYQLGTLGCYLSHIQLLEDILEMEDHPDTVLILEDDCMLTQENLREITKTLENLPLDWDVLRSTWNAPHELEKIEHSHPLSNEYGIHMQKHAFRRIKNFSMNNPLLCPFVETFYGGTHFLLIKFSSIENILNHIKEEVVLPIDALYNTAKLNVYNKKMGITFNLLRESNIIQLKGQ